VAFRPSHAEQFQSTSRRKDRSTTVSCSHKYVSLPSADQQVMSGPVSVSRTPCNPRVLTIHIPSSGATHFPASNYDPLATLASFSTCRPSNRRWSMSRHCLSILTTPWSYVVYLWGLTVTQAKRSSMLNTMLS